MKAFPLALLFLSSFVLGGCGIVIGDPDKKTDEPKEIKVISAENIERLGPPLIAAEYGYAPEDLSLDCPEGIDLAKRNVVICDFTNNGKVTKMRVIPKDSQGGGLMTLRFEPVVAGADTTPPATTPSKSTSPSPPPALAPGDGGEGVASSSVTSDGDAYELPKKGAKVSRRLAAEIAAVALNHTGLIRESKDFRVVCFTDGEWQTGMTYQCSARHADGHVNVVLRVNDADAGVASVIRK